MGGGGGEVVESGVGEVGAFGEVQVSESARWCAGAICEGVVCGVRALGEHLDVVVLDAGAVAEEEAGELVGFMEGLPEAQIAEMELVGFEVMEFAAVGDDFAETRAIRVGAEGDVETLEMREAVGD